MATRLEFNGLVTAINENFKLPIDHYVTVTMEDFRDIVDALGGLEITLGLCIYLSGRL